MFYDEAESDLSCERAVIQPYMYEPQPRLHPDDAVSENSDKCQQPVKEAAQCMSSHWLVVVVYQSFSENKVMWHNNRVESDRSAHFNPVIYKQHSPGG